MTPTKQVVSLDNQKLTLSNMSKVLYPETNITKAEIIQYYLQIAPLFIEFAENRPLSLIRFPDGILKDKFYTKNRPDFTPEFISSVAYTDDDTSYLLANSRPALVWMANLASLEIHADNLSILNEKPIIDHFILDLDPPDTFSFEQLKELSLNLMDFLSSLGMHPFIKTSGSKGVHMYVPIEKIPFSDQFIQHTQKIAQRITEKFPKQTSLTFRKNKREGKVFVDMLRNRFSQTCVLPFSTRALKGAPVSMPVHIDDFKNLDSSQEFTIHNALDYIKDKGFAWADFASEAIDFLGSGPKKKSVLVQDEVGKDWFEQQVFEHQLADEIFDIPQDVTTDVFENKWDGIRVFIYVNNGEVKICSRNNRNITDQFPDVVDCFKTKEQGAYVFDAEIISPDDKGKPIFAQVISRLHQKTGNTGKYPAVAYVFDIVVYKNELINDKSWRYRRKCLERSLLDFSSIKLSEVYHNGDLLWDAVKKMGMEGIMIKKKKAPYVFGDRNTNWRKLKVRHEVHCFIIGYTKGSGDRSPYFGSLHIAQKIDNKFVYKGKVGTGWKHAELKELSSIIKAEEVQSEIPMQGITDSQDSIWLSTPYLNCTIKYASLTSSGTFREPVFVELKQSL